MRLDSVGSLFEATQRARLEIADARATTIATAERLSRYIDRRRVRRESRFVGDLVLDRGMT